MYSKSNFPSKHVQEIMNMKFDVNVDVMETVLVDVIWSQCTSSTQNKWTAEKSYSVLWKYGANLHPSQCSLGGHYVM